MKDRNRFVRVLPEKCAKSSLRSSVRTGTMRWSAIDLEAKMISQRGIKENDSRTVRIIQTPKTTRVPMMVHMLSRTRTTQ